jgi:hypothetical protein
MGFKMPKKHVLALSAVVVVAVGRGGPDAEEERQGPDEAPAPRRSCRWRRKAAPAIEFAGLAADAAAAGRPVAAGHARAAGPGRRQVTAKGRACRHRAAARSAAAPPTVTTIAPPARRCRPAPAQPSSRLRLRRSLSQPRRQSRLHLQACAGANPGRQRRLQPSRNRQPVASGGALVRRSGRQLRGADPRHQLRSGRRKTSSRSRAASTATSRKSSTASPSTCHLRQLRQP